MLYKVELLCLAKAIASESAINHSTKTTTLQKSAKESALFDAKLGNYLAPIASMPQIQ